MCKGYRGTNTFFEEAGKDYDKNLKEWKKEVEEGAEKNNLIVLWLENENETLQLREELVQHRVNLHPGYSFTNNNVDVRILPLKDDIDKQEQRSLSLTVGLLQEQGVFKLSCKGRYKSSSFLFVLAKC